MLDMLRNASLSAKRRTVQVAALLALHSSWGPEAKWFCNPVLSCHSCHLAWFACPIGVFVAHAGTHIFPLLAIGMVVLLGVLAGRLLCGWVCPFGFLQDMLHKIPTPKIHLPGWTSRTKYGVLALFVLLLPFFLGAETLLSFCRICPASALQVTIPNFFIGNAAVISPMTIVKLGVLVFVLGAVIVSNRAFCKVLCPIGAMLAPFNYVSFWKIAPPTTNCQLCAKCKEVCPQDGHPGERIAEGIAPNREAECIVCHECQDACPSDDRARRRKAAKRKKERAREQAAAPTRDKTNEEGA